MKLNEVAAAIHADMCEDDSNGYSWLPRHGEDGKGMKTLTIDGNQYSYDRGSYDCSSSTILAWELALGIDLDCETTYDMKQAFLDTGLFEWKPMSFQACPGDLYLDEDQHVAMCQPSGTYSGTYYEDPLSEFSLNEKGGVYNGKAGDQTGREAYVHEFYDNGNWDGILHYKGGEASTDSSSKKITVKAPESPEYRVFRGGKWRAWRKNNRIVGIQSEDIYDMDFKNLGPEGWFQLTLEDGSVLAKNKKNDDHSKRIMGITVFYDTPDPENTGYYEAIYQVCTSEGKWLKEEHDDDDDGAGDDKHPIRRFRLKIESC